MNVIFGASGHAKEIESLLRERAVDSLKVDFFVAPSHEGAKIKNIPVISEEIFIKFVDNKIENRIFIAIGSSKIRRIIVDKLLGYENLTYPNLIPVSNLGDYKNIQLGFGNVFFPNVSLTTDIVIGNHNHFNLNSSVSHDCMIGDYNTFSPGVMIAGSVEIGNNNFFGMGAKVIDKVRIVDNVTIGAGAVVIKNISEAGTYVGVPAMKVK